MKYFATLFALFFALCTQAFAHESGESYVFVEFHDDYIEGRFEFRLDELREKMGIDVMENGERSIEKLQAEAEKAHAYILNGFSIGPDPATQYEIEFTEAVIFNPEGGWAQYHFRLNSDTIPPELHITYDLGFENDRLHRCVFIIEEGDWPSKEYKMYMTLVFTPSNKTQVLDTVNPPELMNTKRMVWQGMLHIWIGVDHILFLIALALPIVLVRRENSWKPVEGLRKSLWPLLKIVTVFTIAHSITLLLAGLDIISINSRFVESVIALSIIIVALANILGKSHRTSLFVILALGLFHGLGFASVMGDLPFRIYDLKEFLFMIIGFNIGVELGQIAILLVAFPVLFVLRKASFYPPLVLTGGSAALVMIAGYWFIQRAFGL